MPIQSLLKHNVDAAKECIDYNASIDSQGRQSNFNPFNRAMQLPKSKKEIQREINKQIQDYIDAGGVVHEIPKGVSGNLDNDNLFKSSAMISPKLPRTPLNDVVKTLEERKHAKSKHHRLARGKPHKKLLVDDFGDPVRWVWEDQK